MSRPATFDKHQLKGDANSLKNSILEHLQFTLAKDKYSATKRDLFNAVAHTVRDQLVGRWITTQQQYYDTDAKRVYYLSLEFLIGRTMRNSLVNLGLLDNCRKAVHDLGASLDELFDEEMDAGLGNGGLGRLAACFLDSMATLSIPGYGYGIRYDYGIFTQKIYDGYQVETPDNWLRYGNPWEMCRSEYLYPVHFYGQTAEYTDGRGKLRSEWTNTTEVMAMAYDTPVPGFENDTVNTLRLWQAKSSRGFDLSYFNHGDYIRATEDIATTENISRVLYPNDNISEGKELRLKQEYFLVSATIQDIVRRYNKAHIHLDQLPDKVAIQLNDTHPALAIAEMMHILVDREELSWDKAWEITKSIFNYTNHTLLPEALERWPVSLIEKVLPRHMQIIYEINRRWLNEVAQHFPGDESKQKTLSIVEEKGEKIVNMAHLAIVGAHRVNGVSALHSSLLKRHTFREFATMYPDRFINVTNGITPRRWVWECNPRLASLISSKIGREWPRNLSLLSQLKEYAHETSFLDQLLEIKRDNKEALANVIYNEHDTSIDLNSLFDCQVKRIHEYKRQLLNALHVIHLYNTIKDHPEKDWTPRTVIFSGKAAPGYFMAKHIIKLINAVAKQVNHHPEVSRHLKVFFLANYRVSLAEKLIPAADLSEQISTAGTEASGTGNMKFALNGALTIGTLDGANVEMLEEVGQDNMMIFGLKAEEVAQLKQKGYCPRDYYERDKDLKRVLDMITSGYFSSGDRDLFRPITQSLLDQGDTYCLLADFAAYVAKQEEVSVLYKDKRSWAKKCLYNIASMGKFSSDRSIEDYANFIWDLN